MKRKIYSSLLIILGAIIFLYPKITEMYQNNQQQKLLNRWEDNLNLIDQGVDEVDAEEDDQEEQSEVSEPTHEAQTDTQQAEPNNEAYIQDHMEGILEIEKINLQLPILKGVSKKSLDISVASLDNTPKAGEIGNYVIAGHRSRTYGRNFNRLDEIEIGDVIDVKNAQNQYHYTVFDKQYVLPEEVWVLNGHENQKEITLITCHPMNNPTHRLIIKAKME